MATSWQLLTVATVEIYCKKKRFVPHRKKNVKHCVVLEVFEVS